MATLTDGLDDGVRAAQRELIDSARSTAASWQLLKPDLLEIVNREKAEADRKYDEEVRKSRSVGRRRVIPVPRLWSHRTVGDEWLSWAGPLEVLGLERAQRILKLPQEARILALKALEQQPEGSVQAKSAAVEKTVKGYEKAVFSLAGDRFPELADAIAKKLGGELLVVGNRAQARHRYVRVRSGRKRGSAVIRVPRWELFGLEEKVVRRRFAEAAGSPPKNDPVLFIGGDSDYVSNELLPEHFTARAFEASMAEADRHLGNLQSIVQRSIDPANVAFFNGLPKTREEVDAFKVPGSYRTWERTREDFEAVREKSQVASATPTRETFLAELSAGERDVITVVAHGTPDGIFLGPNEKVTVEDIKRLGPRQGGKAPLIILIACRTGGGEKGSRAIAQMLLEQGFASAVVAPTRPIRPRAELASFLGSVLKGTNLQNVLKTRPKDLELWVEDRAQGVPDPMGLRARGAAFEFGAILEEREPHSPRWLFVLEVEPLVLV